MLLKVLEEPPPSTVFVILAEQLPLELVTIASRCVQVDFGPLRVRPRSPGGPGRRGDGRRRGPPTWRRWPGKARPGPGCWPVTPASSCRGAGRCRSGSTAPAPAWRLSPPIWPTSLSAAGVDVFRRARPSSWPNSAETGRAHRRAGIGAQGPYRPPQARAAPPSPRRAALRPGHDRRCLPRFTGRRSGRRQRLHRGRGRHSGRGRGHGPQPHGGAPPPGPPPRLPPLPARRAILDSPPG